MFFALTIDLDPAWCYHRIYGLGEVERTSVGLECSVSRFLELTSDLGIPGSIFVVGETLSDNGLAAVIAQASALGHEICNHTHSHPYDLCRLDDDRIAREVEQGAADIERATGERPKGFRAPGYSLGSRVLPALINAGAVYDSSILPSPVYQGVKAAVFGWLWLRGRNSGAFLADPRETLGPRGPYRPDPISPWRRGTAGLIELPIGTVMGLPLTGGLLALAGPSRTTPLATLVSRKGFVCLELHALDLLDIQADGLDPALAVQPDLSIAWQRKAEAIRNFCERLLSTHKATTLARAAKILS
jgi:peptidoglycan-N-acetylglucosamine deacetylase